MATVLATNPTPTELLTPIEATGVFKRRLVLRNALSGVDLLVKLVQKPQPKEQAVAPRLSWAVVKAGGLVQLEMAIEPARLAVGQQIYGYVRVKPESSQAAERWLNGSLETKQQLAFTLLVRPSPAFSAYDTVIDLPGSAVLVEPKIAGRIGADDLGCEDALLLDADTTTARGFGSLENVVVELSKGPKVVTATEDACWLLKRVFNCEDENKKKARQKTGERLTSQETKKRTAVLESQYVEPSMNRLF